MSFSHLQWEVVFFVQYSYKTNLIIHTIPHIINIYSHGLAPIPATYQFLTPSQ